MTLKEFLSSRRIDQKAFAKMIGFTQQAVSHWVSGACIPRRGAMARIAKATGGMGTANDFMPTPSLTPTPASQDAAELDAVG